MSNENYLLVKSNTYCLKTPFLNTVSFYCNNGKTTGRIFEKDGKWSFEGDLNESAEVFVKEIINGLPELKALRNLVLEFTEYCSILRPLEDGRAYTLARLLMESGRLIKGSK